MSYERGAVKRLGRVDEKSGEDWVYWLGFRARQLARGRWGI